MTKSSKERLSREAAIKLAEELISHEPRFRDSSLVGLVKAVGLECSEASDVGYGKGYEMTPATYYLLPPYNRVYNPCGVRRRSDR